MPKAETHKAHPDRLELTAGEIPMFLGLASTERGSYQWVDWNIVFEFDSSISAKSGDLAAVSYTHLTLPTILLV